MPETTTYADVLREAFQGYYHFIIKESSCGEYKDYHEAYNEKLKPYIEILAKENLLLSMPDGKKITCFEDVKALDRELFHCWPYYSYEEMDEKGYYTIGVFGGKERKVYNSSLMNNRSAKLKEYFHIQYVECLKRLDAIERGIQLAPERQSNGQGVPQGVFPVPPEAKANDIEMTFQDNDNIHITIKEESRLFHYSQIGFSNKANNRPLAAWDTLLEYAEHNGSLGNVNGKKQKDSERINQKLKAFFNTQEDLIIKNQTVFKIKKKGNNKRPICTQQQECPECKETHTNYCFTCNAETQECKECHNELYKEIHTKTK